MNRDILYRAHALEMSLKKYNNKSSDFFSDIIKNINNSKSNKELKEILESLKSIGSISQYGNFTNEQDVLLEELLKEIKLLLSKL